jgi:hypothetical protein
VAFSVTNPQNLVVPSGTVVYGTYHVGVMVIPSLATSGSVTINITSTGAGRAATQATVGAGLSLLAGFERQVLAEFVYGPPGTIP